VREELKLQVYRAWRRPGLEEFLHVTDKELLTISRREGVQEGGPIQKTSKCNRNTGCDRLIGLPTARIVRSKTRGEKEERHTIPACRSLLGMTPMVAERPPREHCERGM